MRPREKSDVTAQINSRDFTIGDWTVMFLVKHVLPPVNAQDAHVASGASVTVVNQAYSFTPAYYSDLMGCVRFS